MKITFTNLYIENFMPFSKDNLKLNFPGYSFIKGVNNNITDNAISNGSGKTAILEALNWVLTGETIRGAKDIVNHNGNDGALVKLSFIVDEDEYLLVRSKDHSKYKTTLKIYINGEDKSAKGIRDTQKRLEEFLPDLNSSLIGSVIILGQGLPQRFTNNTPSGRKEVLETLSKSDFMIKDLKDRIIIRKDFLSNKVREYEDEILQLKAKESLLRNQIEEKDSQLKNLESFNKEDQQERVKFLEKEILQCKNTIEYLNKEIDSSNNKISKITEDISLLSSKQIEDSEKIKKEFDTSKLLEKKAELSSRIRILANEIRTLESVTDICPTCGQKLPNVHKIDTTDKNKEYDNLVISFNKVDKEFEELNSKLQERLDVIKSTFISSKSSLDKELESIKDYILNNRNLIEKETNNVNLYSEEKTTINNILENWKSNIEACKDFIKQHRTSLIQIDGDISSKNIELSKIKDHLDIINKFYSIITRDFRGYLLSSVIAYINKKAKEYSKEIFGTDKLDFSLDGNNISISYDNKEYESLSGGEKQKVDLIVQFSIRDMLCKYLNFSSNILALDELTDNLDIKGTENLLNLISKKLNDVESIYIISHHSDFQIPSDREILVIKNSSGVSHIEA